MQTWARRTSTARCSLSAALRSESLEKVESLRSNGRVRGLRPRGDAGTTGRERVQGESMKRGIGILLAMCSFAAPAVVFAQDAKDQKPAGDAPKADSGAAPRRETPKVVVAVDPAT